MLKYGSCWVEGDRPAYVFYRTGGTNQNLFSLCLVETCQNLFPIKQM